MSEIDLEQLNSIYDALKRKAGDFVKSDDWKDNCEEFLEGVNGIDLGKFALGMIYKNPELKSERGLYIAMFVMFAMGLEAGRREKFMEQFEALID